MVTKLNIILARVIKSSVIIQERNKQFSFLWLIPYELTEMVVQKDKDNMLQGMIVVCLCVAKSSYIYFTVQIEVTC